MEKDRKFRALAIAAICIAVVGVSVAYAALATTLIISGTATVDTDASWNIHWDEAPTVTNKTNSVTLTDGPEISGDKLTWAAKVTAPGDTFTINAQIVNDGTLAARLSSGADIVIEGPENVKKHFTAVMTVDNKDKEAQAGKVLKGKTAQLTHKIPVKIVVTFANLENEAWTALGQETEKTVKFTASLPFVQAADSETTYFVGNDTQA